MTKPPQAVSHKTFCISDQSPQPDHVPFVCRADLLRNHARPHAHSPYRTGRTLPWATMLSSEEKRCSAYRYPLSVYGEFWLSVPHLRHTTEHHTGTERKQDAGLPPVPMAAPHAARVAPAVKNIRQWRQPPGQSGIRHLTWPRDSGNNMNHSAIRQSLM